MKAAESPLVMAIALAIILTVSGCTTFCIPGMPGLCPNIQSEKADILVISDFSAIPNTVRPGQPSKLVVFVENKGKTTIRSKDTSFTDGSITVQLFDYCKGLFEIEKKQCPGPAIPEKDICIIEKILPGQAVEVDWNIIPKQDVTLKTVCPSDGVKVLVKYPFLTESITTMSLINQKELQQQIEQRTLKSEKSYITLGEGPVKPFLTIEDKQPIPIIGSPNNAKGTTVIALQIKNQGSGFLKDNKISKDKIFIDFGRPEIKPLEGGECNFEPAAGKPEKGILSKTENQLYRPKEDVKLIGDSSPKLLCEISIEQYVPIKSTNHMTVSIEYEYEFRDKEKITIEPAI